ncbi:MAG: hypothetical protein JO150_08115 [Acidobacteriaceae bacterium]|nr:hypothetical protein [Acidobacteriaceae bacterium]
MRLTFKQFVTELAREDVTLSAADLREMTARFGRKVLQMGHLEQDGSMLVPVECIVEAARSLGSRMLTEAVESINNEQMVSVLQSGEALVERVIEARERKLREMIQDFQEEPDITKSNGQWKQIEKEVFGVEYHD